MRMLEVYRQFMEDYLAIPVITGVKSDTEKFAGALKTFTIEAIMQDKKSLQCGTSHDLGQNFAKVFDVKFLDNTGNEQYVWQTSWGVSTRLIGALIMVHGDDKGIIVPPRIAPTHLAFVPIWKSEEEKTRTMAAARRLADTVPNFSSEIDSRDIRPAWKYYEWERKGVPLRVEIGPRDIENHQAVLVRRDTGEKIFVKEDEFAKRTTEILEAIQQNLFERAKRFREENIHEAKIWSEFQEIIEKQGGFVRAGWCGSAECEAQIKEKTKATIRCMPVQEGESNGECICCRKPARHNPLFAQSY